MLFPNLTSAGLDQPSANTVATVTPLSPDRNRTEARRTLRPDVARLGNPSQRDQNVRRTGKTHTGISPDKTGRDLRHKQLPTEKRCSH